MEGEPGDVVHEGESRGCQGGAKGVVIDAVFLVFAEVESGFLKEIDGAFGEHVVFEGEAEIEGPGAGDQHEIVEVGRSLHEGRVGLLRREFALRGPDGDAKLDGLEQIDVAAEGLVVIRGFVFKVANGAGYYAREFRVLFGVRMEV